MSDHIFYSKMIILTYLPSPILCISHHLIPWSTSVKYPGTILDIKLLFRHHIKFTMEKFHIAIELMYPLTRRVPPYIQFYSGAMCTAVT